VIDAYNVHSRINDKDIGLAGLVSTGCTRAIERFVISLIPETLADLLSAKGCSSHAGAAAMGVASDGAGAPEPFMVVCLAEYDRLLKLVHRGTAISAVVRRRRSSALTNDVRDAL